MVITTYRICNMNVTIDNKKSLAVCLGGDILRRFKKPVGASDIELNDQDT